MDHHGIVQLQSSALHATRRLMNWKTINYEKTDKINPYELYDIGKSAFDMNNIIRI